MKIMRVKQSDGTLVDIPIGMEATNSAISTHNMDKTAHADIREQINQLSSEKVNNSQLTTAVNNALAQAKVSGEFDGQDGKTPYIQNGYWYIDGVNTNVKAEGLNGKDGFDYVLTDADKEEIAGMVTGGGAPEAGKIFAPSPQLPADATDEADFNADSMTAQDIYNSLDELCEKYPNYISKETLGREASGKYNVNRYVLCKHYYSAWQRNNYPKMYGWVNGDTVIYSTSISPRIGDEMYSTDHIGTTEGTVTAVSNANKTRTVNGVVYTRDATKDVDPSLVYTSILADTVGSTVYNGSKTTATTISSFTKTLIPDFKNILDGTTLHVNQRYSKSSADYVNSTGHISTDWLPATKGQTIRFNVPLSAHTATNCRILCKTSDGSVYWGDGEASHYMPISEEDNGAITSIKFGTIYNTAGNPSSGTKVTGSNITQFLVVLYVKGITEETAKDIAITLDEPIKYIEVAALTGANGITYTRYPMGDRDNNMEKFPVVTIGANEHAPTGDPREPAIVCTRMIRDLCERRNSNNALLNHLKNNVMLVMMPIINPFGFNKGSNGSGLDGYYNSNGVNINRNYDTPGWSTGKEHGAYGGSEIETQYFMNTISEHNSAVAISVHCLASSTEANRGLCHYQGNNFNTAKLRKIAETMVANYNLKFTTYGDANPATTAKSPSYITQAGAKGGIIEMNDYDIASASFHSAFTMEANYTLLLNCIYIWLGDSEGI